MEAFNSEDDENYGDGESWMRGELLGEGNFGEVFLATSTGKSSYPSVMAVKSVDITCADSLRHEWSVLRCLSGCSSVIQCFGAEVTRKNDGYMAYNLLLEYCSGGTLHDQVRRTKDKSLPEPEARWYARSILEGLVKIHEAGFVHCDLKPENILLFPNRKKDGENFKFRAKICDLGVAKGVKEDGQKSKFDRIWQGTSWYFAPEAVGGNIIQEPAADIWSLGIMVLEMLTGRPAWGPVQRSWANIRMLHEQGCRPIIPKDLSPVAKSFLHSCLRRTAKKRETAKSLLRHPFITGIEESSTHSLFSEKMALAFHRLRSSLSRVSR